MTQPSNGEQTEFPPVADGGTPATEVINVGSVGGAEPAPDALTFEEALDRGLAAADAADVARAEIQAVLDEFAIAIGRKVSVALTAKLDESAKELVLSKSNGPHVAICRFTLSLHGYPVDIENADFIVSCHDGVALRATLVGLLRRPDIARRIKSLTS